MNINLFMIDEEPTGRIKCRIETKSGVVYKIPRRLFDSCKDSGGDIVKHLKQTGIYFLIGENSDGKQTIYIGQADARKTGDALNIRLSEHIKNEKEKYWNDWNEIIVFTTTDNSLHSTQISYLENKFRNLAIEANRYLVQNGNEPNKGNISEEDESNMQSYIKDICMIVGILGYKMFEPLVKHFRAETTKNVEEMLFNFQGKFKARGVFTNEGFVLLKGSEINSRINKSAHESTINAREQKKDKISNENTTTEDILFTSPSAAAGFVGGSSLSGNALWKTKDGKSPKDFNL